MIEWLFISIINLIIAAWMVSNCRDRGGKASDQLGAFILGILFGIIGLVVWFLIRPKHSAAHASESEKSKKGWGIGTKIVIGILAFFFSIVIIGGIISVWMSGLATTQTTTVSSTTDKQIKCAASAISIKEVKSDCANNKAYVTVVYYSGTENLYNLTVDISGGGETAKSSYYFSTSSDPLESGKDFTLAIDTIGLTCPYDYARVRAFCLGGVVIVGECKSGDDCMKTPKGGVYFKGGTSVISAGVAGSYYIVGELLNNGTTSYESYEIKIVADLYKGGNLVDTQFGFPTTDLLAGGSTSFKILLFSPPDFDSYKLKVSSVL